MRSALSRCHEALLLRLATMKTEYAGIRIGTGLSWRGWQNGLATHEMNGRPAKSKLSYPTVRVPARSSRKAVGR
jgi:hypothetical protein